MNLIKFEKENIKLKGQNARLAACENVRAATDEWAVICA